MPITVHGPPQPKRSFGQEILQGMQEASQLYQQHKQAEAETDIIGKEYRGTSPEFRKMALESKFRQTEKAAELKGKTELSDETVELIRSKWGDEAADIYQAATSGGKTKVLQALIEGGQRNLDVRQSLGLPTERINAEISPNEQIPGEEPIEVPKTTKQIDFDKGLTPKERTKRQDSRYSINLPLYQDAQAKYKAHEMEAEELGILADLSPKIGVIERLNINPLTGDLLIPMLGSPDAQRFVKTINDFTRLAKDSYGARVTNFDLEQFMRRLPTLANSEEGRRAIIEQMQIINDINRVYEKSLNDVIDEYGGIRNIDFDQAESMANKRADSEVKTLKSRLKSIGNQAEKTYTADIEAFKKTVPKDHVAVQKSNGDIGYIPKEKLEGFLKKNPKNKAL